MPRKHANAHWVEGITLHLASTRKLENMRKSCSHVEERISLCTAVGFCCLEVCRYSERNSGIYTCDPAILLLGIDLGKPHTCPQRSMSCNFTCHPSLLAFLSLTVRCSSSLMPSNFLHYHDGPCTLPSDASPLDAFCLQAPPVAYLQMALGAVWAS